MTIGSNSYGSMQEVEALAVRYTDERRFTAATTPSREQVETFIDRVSAIINVALAQAGFAIPVTQADAASALGDFVVDHVVQLCHAVNGAGPYAPGSENLRGRRPRAAILQEAFDFVEDMAAGLEALGATRTRTLTSGLSCREQDAAGDDLVPPFHREMIDHEIIDWDPA
jgi:hypothetical protein